MTIDTILADQQLIENLKSLVIQAGNAIVDIYESDNFDTSLKGDNSPLTKADLTAHHILVEGLKGLSPHLPIISEEDSDTLSISQQYDTYWLIDPLDGTKEFINKSNEFTVNLALIHHKNTAYGFVGVPALNTLYWGGKGYGAFKTNTPLECNTKEKIQVSDPQSTLRVFASKSHLNAETEAFIESLGSEVQLVQAGSSLKFLRIAEGLADLYPRLAPTCEWDTAAAQAVLEGAGGTVSQPDNSPVVYGKAEILNPHFIAKGKV